MTDRAPADAALAYIKFVMAELQLSANALAKKAGLSSSTLTRPLNSDAYKFAPSLVTLAKIGRATGIDPAPFLSANNFRDLSMVPFIKNIYDESWGSGLYAENDIGMAVTIGEAAAGEWKEVEIAPFTYAVPVFSGQSGSESFSLIAKGKSADLIAQEGNLFLCVSTEALKRNEKHTHPIAAMFHPFNRNSLLVIERRTEDRKLIEISVRYPIWMGTEWHFICPSSDPVLRKPLTRPNLESDPLFAIIGQVSWVLGHTSLDDALMQKMMLTK